jgi:hypothetical protein
MEVRSVLGLAGLIMVVALAATALKQGSTTAAVLDSASSGFARIIQAATLQPMQG